MGSIIQKGIGSAPSAGGGRGPGRVSVDCAELYREANGVPDDGNNYGPTGAVLSLEAEEGFEYLYYIDGRGKWNSVAFRVAGMEG